MGRKDEAHAEELMRSYNYARRFVGVIWDDEAGPVVLSQPDFPREQLAELVALLLADAHPSSDAVGRLIGAREVFAITPGHLGKGWFHLGALERSNLQRFIDDGVRPLRSLRGRDVPGLLAMFRTALERAQQPVVRPLTLVDRLERLFGDDGVLAFERYERAVTPRARRTSEQKLEDFVETAERVARDEGPVRAELRDLWLRMAKLPREPVALARALVSCLRDLAGGETPHELGRRRTLEAQIRGLDLVAAARRLVALVDEPSAETEDASEWTRAQRNRLLQLALILRGTSLDLPDDPELVEPLAVIAERRSSELDVLWPRLLDKPARALSNARWTLSESSLPAELLADALDLEVFASVFNFDNGTSLRLYLDAVRQLHAHPIAGIRPTDDWFVRPFSSGLSWEPALMLGLLANHRKDPEALVATLAAVRSANLADFGFADVFARWDEPVLDHRPAEFDAVGEALNLTVTELERYVHWRRLCGYESDFSEAVLKPVRQAEREQRELSHLLTMEQTPSLQQRIESLQDPERRRLRSESTGRRARNAFDRAMEVLRRESLDAVMDGVTRSTFERILGRAIRGELPPRLRSLMLLVSAENIDFDELRNLLEDVLAGNDPADRAANMQWLQTMRARGVDTERWRRGISVELNIAGGVIEVETETDPLHVLEMGSYFETCLSLEDGFNAASTLTNAIDVNKQVLYGRRPDGTVVARKLIAVTDDGTLLGYRTYAFENQPQLDARLGAAIAEFADACGLRLGTQGQPRALHGTFWYDDGVAPWHLRPDVEVPDGIPGDEVAVTECAYWRGFEDPTWWTWGATLDCYPWSEVCAARAFDGSQADDLPSNARLYLAARGNFDWLAGGEVDPYDDLREVVYVIPATADAAKSYTAAMRAARRPQERDWGELVAFPAAAAALAPAEVAMAVVDHVRLLREVNVECFVQQHEDCISTFVRGAADVLEASWFRAGDGSVDRLFASRDPLVRRIATSLAQRVRSPEIGRRVRAMFKAEGATTDLVWALGRQADSASIWALESALESDPSNLDIVAALQTFAPEPEQASRARAAMRLPARFPGAGLVRDLHLDASWPDAGHGALAEAGLELCGEKHRDAFEHAIALRNAGTATNQVWGELARKGCGHLFHPSRVEAMRLREGLYALDQDAIAHALQRFGHDLLGLVAIALGDEQLEARWPLIEFTSNGYQIAVMRELVRRTPPNASLLAFGSIGDEWNLSRVFAGRIDLWSRYLHELAAQGQTRHAMMVCSAFAVEVGPQEFDAVVHELWGTHAEVFVADAAGVIENMLADRWAECASYRLLDAFMAWVAPRCELDLGPLLVGKQRSEWTIERWKQWCAK